MSVQLPKFWETFIPILEVLSDGRALHYNDLRKVVREKYYAKLPEELLALKTKGGDPIILDRINWGKVYLKQAGMIWQPERAMVQITNKGRDILKRGSLSFKELRADEDFIANSKQGGENSRVDEGIDDQASPQDMIDSGFQAIETRTKLELLSKLKTTDPYYFQKVILDLLEKMGYGDLLETPKSGDGGIDGIINQDKLGLEKIYIQAKRYTDNKVREGEVRNFIGAMGRDTNKGIFVTTSTFDEKALKKAYDAGQKIITIDGLKLVELMMKYNIGLQVRSTYEVKVIDEDYFEVEN